MGRATSMRRRFPTGRLSSLLVIAAGTLACAEPVGFPEWTLQIPEGVPVREYQVAAVDAREGDPIEIVTDLVIGDASGDGAAAFFNPRDLVADDDGRIYVLDAGNHRVQVFAADGEFLNTFGNQGQGPGELMAPTTITLVDEGIVVNDFITGRLNVWNREGEYLAAREHERRFAPRVVVGDRDSFVVGYAEEHLEGFPLNVTARFTLAGEEVERISEVPIRGLVRVRVSSTVSEGYAEGANTVRLSMNTHTQPRYALGRDGAMYLAAGDEYQVLAVGPDGAPRWALRTALPMPEMPMAVIDALVERSDRTSSRSDYEWDALLPAIESIRVDGHGHLWVYPTVPEHARQESDLGIDVLRPVDVYSPDGELLFSGLVDSVRWRVSLGDFVYELTVDSETEEPAVVRYRLYDPF